MTISEEQRRLYRGTVLLGHMVARNIEYDVLLLGSEGNLEPILQWLLTRELVTISSDNHYQPSTLGLATDTAFKRRYRRTLQYFDVFSAVDLSSGEFAMASHPHFQSDAAWLRFLQDDRWEDLRVAVAHSLDADPLELVFAHFMQEGRFNFEDGGWQISLLEGLIWQEIEEICQHSLKVADLGYDQVPGEQVITDVIEQGFLLVRELSDEEPKLMGHLARWLPSRQATTHPPDDSLTPFWKTRWNLDLPDS